MEIKLYCHDETGDIIFQNNGGPFTCPGSSILIFYWVIFIA
jgi:hypothetical protein